MRRRTRRAHRQGGPPTDLLELELEDLPAPESPPAALRSCPHCGRELPRSVEKWSLIRRLVLADIPGGDSKRNAEMVRIIKLLFPEDTTPMTSEDLARYARMGGRLGGRPPGSRDRGARRRSGGAK